MKTSPKRLDMQISEKEEKFFASTDNIFSWFEFPVDSGTKTLCPWCSTNSCWN